MENEKQTLYAEEEILYSNFVEYLAAISIKKDEYMDVYQRDNLNQQKQERAYIEEESGRLKLIRDHLDLDLKVWPLME